jgi:hypothetical protein
MPSCVLLEAFHWDSRPRKVTIVRPSVGTRRATDRSSSEASRTSSPASSRRRAAPASGHEHHGSTATGQCAAGPGAPSAAQDRTTARLRTAARLRRSGVGPAHSCRSRSRAGWSGVNTCSSSPSTRCRRGRTFAGSSVLPDGRCSWTGGSRRLGAALRAPSAAGLPGPQRVHLTRLVRRGSIPASPELHRRARPGDPRGPRRRGGVLGPRSARSSTSRPPRTTRGSWAGTRWPTRGGSPTRRLPSRSARRPSGPRRS